MPDSVPKSMMYQAIGQAVVFAQLFETLIVVCSEMVRTSKEFQEGKPTDFMVNSAKFRQATKRIINELASANDIDTNLEARITALVDKRHTLIHRWGIENGWPSEDDLPEMQRIIDLASEITSESAEISQLLTKFILKNSSAGIDMRIKLGVLFKEALLADFSES